MNALIKLPEKMQYHLIFYSCLLLSKKGYTIEKLSFFLNTVLHYFFGIRFHKSRYLSIFYKFGISFMLARDPLIAEELYVRLIFGRSFIFRTDKYRNIGVILYIFGLFSNFGRTKFYGRIKDSPSAQEPLKY